MGDTRRPALEARLEDRLDDPARRARRGGRRPGHVREGQGTTAAVPGRAPAAGLDPGHQSQPGQGRAQAPPAAAARGVARQPRPAGDPSGRPLGRTPRPGASAGGPALRRAGEPAAAQGWSDLGGDRVPSRGRAHDDTIADRQGQAQAGTRTEGVSGEVWVMTLKRPHDSLAVELAAVDEFLDDVPEPPSGLFGAIIERTSTQARVTPAVRGDGPRVTPMIPTYLGHSHRPEDRELNRYFLDYFWEAGFAFTVNPRTSGQLSIPHL